MTTYAFTLFFLLVIFTGKTPIISAFSSSGVLPNQHQKHRGRSLATATASAHQEENPNADPSYYENPNNNSGGSSTAIILNLNARSVSGSSKELISLASKIVGEKHVYVTRTIEDALLAARMVIRQGRCDETTSDSNDGLLPYSLVVPVGGDGTLSGWIDGMVNEVLLLEKLSDPIHKNDNNHHHHHQMRVHEAVSRLPAIGYIPMGTGNGLGYVIGCRMPKSKKSCKISKEKSHGEENDDKKKKKWRGGLMSKLSLKRRKVEHAGLVMRKLKQIGDELQQRGQQQQTGGSEYSIVEMPLMEVTHHSPDEQNITKGDLCFFAGSGFDSLMLEDFKQVKAWSSSSQRTPSFIKDMLSSVAGYCVALVTKTLPQTLLHQTHKINVKVTTTDEDTLWIDHRRGDFSELAVGMSKEEMNNNEGGLETDEVATKDKKRQHLIYSGVTGILAASTTPFYGGGMRLFPYARLFPNKLQLRIGRISPLTGFLRIPAIFEGSYRDKSEGDFGCLDFVGDDFEVEVSSSRYEEYLKRKKEQKEGKKKKKTRGWRLRRRQRRRSDNDVASDDETAITTGFPFQHSGESMGVKERFRVRVVKQPVKFISFLEPRIVVDD
jgi:diacylglycerol kinase family enzyme